MHRETLSAVVIACNRAWAIETCLGALSFADEVVVIDKASTDGTAERALPLADRVIRVPRTPTVEETRGFAVAQSRGAWVLLLDDDECLDPALCRFIDAELVAPRADLFALPRREYILGRHEPGAYYWPEWHPRLFRRDAVSFAATVHCGIEARTDRQFQVPPDGGAVIHHLSHRSVAEWVEKTNRYTSRPDRVRVGVARRDLARFAHDAIDRWTGARPAAAPDDATQAVALLRASYDLVDRLKSWEEERGLDGAAAFGAVCTGLRAAYAVELAPLARPHGSTAIEALAPPPGPEPEAGRIAALAHLVAGLREELAAGAAAAAATEARLAAEVAVLSAALSRAEARVTTAEAARAAIVASRFWRATGPARRLVDALARRRDTAPRANPQPSSRPITRAV